MKTGGRASPLTMPTPMGPTAELIDAARAEGRLTVIALPRDWNRYGDIIDGFKARYGLQVDEYSPQAGSLDELDAIRKARDGFNPQPPDVIDIGMSFAPAARREGLLRAYKVSAWAAIPDVAKETDGFWTSGYSDRIVFEVNLDRVATIPGDWADLAAPEFRNAVALPGNLKSEQAIHAIFSAGLSSSGGNVAAAANEGLRFVSGLHRTGNFASSVGDSVSLADGRTPVLIRWESLARADCERFKDKTRIGIVRPRSGASAGTYVQAISAYAPHPNAAKLWMEHLWSEEVQHIRLGTHPTLVQYRNRDNLDPYFPTPEEQEKARETITRGWDSIVGVKILCSPGCDPTDVPMVLIQTNASTG